MRESVAERVIEVMMHLPNSEGNQRSGGVASARRLDCDHVVITDAYAQREVELIDTLSDRCDRQRPQFLPLPISNRAATATSSPP